MMRMRNYAGAAALLLTIAVPGFAQQPPMPPRAPKPPHAPMEMGHRMVNVEMALRMKDKLKLTDAQAAQLETLRKEIVAERQAQAREHIDLQSRVAAGLIEPEEVRKQFEGRRDAVMQTIKQRQERVEKVLTEDQREQLGHETHHMMGQRMRSAYQQREPGRGFAPGRAGRDQRPRFRDFRR